MSDAPDPLSPARVEAMAREYCRIMEMDPDERIRGTVNSPKWSRYTGQAREFITMQIAYEGIK